eukprot:CAMPEP_0201689578 /NCGR_PEP_ID=MMETSP0578-20130828/3149_1 /ASSEMBLY_ACC=CAM_ASM_000663 /TAXON_ID=267565 /ORGANISM="Skeletonema grethea, Strain CCMP 1804" /LENGTH=152 /DNA_ID=CAMNT_0048174263 /DNA_START=134 /DNA_END=592 /DNA_ORIENTATION=+
MNAPAQAAAHSLLLLLLLEMLFSTNAFSFDGHASASGSHCQTRLHSSISLHDEVRLQSEGFGITTSPRAVVNARDAASSKPLSRPAAETVSYDEDLDLPYRSLTYDTDPAYETLAAVELSVSRMAMIAALGLFSVELATGTSVLDQVLSMIG